jgi:phosphatidylglycerophosphatase A
MQALLRAATGTCFNKSALNSTSVHQQGAVVSDAILGVAMAQALGCPHKGQRQGSLASCVMTEIAQSLP